MKKQSRREADNNQIKTDTEKIQWQRKL